MINRVLFCALSLVGSAVAENVTTTEDMTAERDWEVSVTEGCTNYVTGVQSGVGKIVKKGGGNLVLSAANTFSGGVVIDEGVVEPAHSAAFGTGDVILNADGTKVCQVRLSTGKLTFGNDLQVKGTTTAAQPALYFAAGTNVWNGAISAEHDLYMNDDGAWGYLGTGGTIAWNGTAWTSSGSSWSMKVSGLPGVTFNGPVSAPEGKIYLVPDTFIVFNGKVTCRVFSNVYEKGHFSYHAMAETSFYANLQFNSANDIQQLLMGYRSPVASSSGALDGTLISWVTKPPYLDTDAGYITARVGTTQRLAALESLPLKDGYYSYNLVGGKFDSPSQIFVTGKGLPNTTYVSGVRLGTGTSSTRFFNFALDGDASNPGFTQVFSNRQHQITGALGVTNATLKLVAGTTFSNVTAVAVGANGSLVCDSTKSGVFKSVQSLSLGGTLKVEEGREWPFSESLHTIALMDGARLQIPETVTSITVKRLSINGQARQCGILQAGELPAGIQVPPTLTIVVTETVPASASATWTGNDETDDLMTTRGNWTAETESVNVTDGSLEVTIADGATNMVPGEGRTFINDIKTSPCGTTADVVSNLKPFILGAPGRKIEIANSVSFNAWSQVVLRGTIAVPEGVGDQGAATENGNLVFYYKAVRTRDLSYPAACYKGLYGYALPLVVDGATITKPYCSRGNTAGDGVLYATPNSTNLFVGKASFWAGGWTEWTVKEGALIEFRGGVESAARIHKVGPGAVKISEKPWTGVSGLSVAEGTVILDAEGCYFGQASVGKGLDLKENGNAAAEFKRSYCFDGIIHQMQAIGKGVKTIEFNCTTQRVAQFYGGATGASSYLHGTYPAMLEIYGGCRKSAPLAACAGMTNMIQVTGGLGFHMVGSGVNNGVAGVLNGADATYVLKGKAFASAGDLEVSGGALMLENDATWRNGTNVTVRGTGRFIFNGERQLNGNIARLHLADEGKINLAGGNLSVASAEVLVDGVWQEVPPGIYTKNTTGLLVGRILGDNKLRVGSNGTCLLLR